MCNLSRQFPKSQNYQNRHYARARARDEQAKMLGKCVLCFAGMPHGDWNAVEYHHIDYASSLPGEGNADELWALLNLAPLCRPHHDFVQGTDLKDTVRRAMLTCKLARVGDYPQIALSPDPLLAQCFGNFGYGDVQFAEGVSAHIAAFYARIGIELDRFCICCCQRATGCLLETRRLRTGRGHA